MQGRDLGGLEVRVCISFERLVTVTRGLPPRHVLRMVPFLDRHLIFPVFNFLQARWGFSKCRTHGFVVAADNGSNVCFTPSPSMSAKGLNTEF